MTNTMLKKLEQQASDLSLESSDGTEVVRLGLIATLYFKNGYTSHTKQKIAACFTRFHEEFKPHLNGMVYQRRVKLNNLNFNNIRDKMLKTDPNEEFSWFLGSASDSSHADKYSLSTLNSFEMHGDHVRSYIKLVLPWEILRQPDGLDTYQNWLSYLCNELEVEHGYGGFSCALPYDYHSHTPTEYELALKYSGLEVDSSPYSFTLKLLEHIKGVNWYTVIGKDFVARLGGESTVRLELSGRAGTQVFSYNNGLIIRAGEFPDLGETTEGLPAAYVEVNKVLKVLRIPQPDQLHCYSPYGNCFEQEETDRWYKRFDIGNSKAPSKVYAHKPCSTPGFWYTPAK